MPKSKQSADYARLFRSFRLKPETEQRKTHIASLGRALTVSRTRIIASYATTSAAAERLRARAAALLTAIGRAEDRVANAADRKYGERRWRSSKKLLLLVCTEMWVKSSDVRARRADLLRRADALIAPLNLELERLNDVHAAAVSACQGGELDQ